MNTTGMYSNMTMEATVRAIPLYKSLCFPCLLDVTSYTPMSPRWTASVIFVHPGSPLLTHASPSDLLQGLQARPQSNSRSTSPPSLPTLSSRGQWCYFEVTVASITALYGKCGCIWGRSWSKTKQFSEKKQMMISEPTQSFPQPTALAQIFSSEEHLHDTHNTTWHDKPGQVRGHSQTLLLYQLLGPSL